MQANTSSCGTGILPVTTRGRAGCPHLLVGQATSLSQLEGGQDAHPTRTLYAKAKMHPARSKLLYHLGKSLSYIKFSNQCWLVGAGSLLKFQ